MKFPIAATMALAGFHTATALPSQPLTEAAEPDVDDVLNSNSTGVEERGLFSTYACTRGANIKLFKSDICKGSAPRTDILNFPLPEGYVGRCQDVTSTSDMLGIKVLSPIGPGAPSLAQWAIYDEPGCKGHRKEILPYGLCSRHDLPTGQDPQPAIKSFKLMAGHPNDCRATSKDGRH